MSDIYFDTNIIIDALARRPQALAELRRAKRQWISRMTWIEVLAGMPVLARAETEEAGAEGGFGDSGELGPGRES